MSNYWDLLCVDCDAHAGMSINNGEEDLARIVASRDKLALVADVPGATVELWNQNYSLPQFFAQHAGHKIVVRSEYGYDFGDCAAIDRCGCCDRQFSCRLPSGHDGKHSPKAPADEVAK